jgi:23S rRNA (guanosine2251-2'-O)-methyltransferase
MKTNDKLSNNALNRVDLSTYKKLDKASILLILDDIRSAINVGSIFRTADAFKIEKIYLCGITAIPPNKDLLKSALGATESVDWEYRSSTSELLKELKEKGSIKIFSIEQTQNSLALNEFKPVTEEKIALIFGNEVEGVSQEVINLSDGSIEIPQFGTKHSFNVAVSAGIVLWDVYAKTHLNNHSNV